MIIPVTCDGLDPLLVGANEEVENVLPPFLDTGFVGELLKLRIINYLMKRS